MEKIYRERNGYQVEFSTKFLWFKVALYTKGSTFNEAMSQYDVLNILWNSFQLSTWLYIIIAQWSKALVLWSTDHEFNSAEDFS